jgi:hypothetical protein
MALTNNLPPQAYTRDTLVKAIEWMSTQPQAVRERANSADLMVSYYLQARRKVAAQIEAPVSGETFKTDLKHLAEDLKQFEESTPPHPNRSASYGHFEETHQASNSSASNSASQITLVQHIAQPTPMYPPPPHMVAAQANSSSQTQQHHHQQQQIQHPTYHHVPMPPLQQPPPVPSHAHKLPTWTIDSRSLAAARDIQQRFNLSCEGEAIRLLLTLGIERAKELGWN